jgi:hypothetical protein
VRRGNTHREAGFEPWKRLTTTPAADLYFEGKLCVKHLQSLLWQFLWRSPDAQSMNGRTIPGSMRPRMNASQSAAFTMDLKRGVTTSQRVGGPTSIGTATSATRPFPVGQFENTGTASTRVMNVHFAAIETAIAIVIGAERPRRRRACLGPGSPLDSFSCEFQCVSMLALRSGGQRHIEGVSGLGEANLL